MALKIKTCLWCNKLFEPTHWNQNYCSIDHRNNYRRDFRQKTYSIRYASKSPRSFLKRLLIKRRYSKIGINLDYLVDLYEGQICRIINTMKYTLSKEELLYWCRKIIDGGK